MKPRRFHASDLKAAGASAISHALSLGPPRAGVFAPLDLQRSKASWADTCWWGTRASSFWQSTLGGWRSFCLEKPRVCEDTQVSPLDLIRLDRLQYPAALSFPSCCTVSEPTKLNMSNMKNLQLMQGSLLYFSCFTQFRVTEYLFNKMLMIFGIGLDHQYTCVSSEGLFYDVTSCMVIHTAEYFLICFFLSWWHSSEINLYFFLFFKWFYFKYAILSRLPNCCETIPWYDII